MSGGTPAGGATPAIVVVEDDAFQRDAVVEYLTKQGFKVTGVEGGAGLRRIAERTMPDLVILDVSLPGEDGFVLARYLRERSSKVGVIMLTASADTVDRVIGLESGADDYVTKPFNARELLARVKSVLRRASKSGPQPKLDRVRMGSGTLDLTRRVLIDADGVEQTLAASEFDLLKLFADNPNRPLARDWLLESTSHRDLEAFDRAIDLRILRLRRKIEKDPSHPEAIRTVRGIGYMFVPPSD
ncbi:response regulator [Terrarubrum flagellatum]|uniref:response regulator n=1 Tax=Terrirubrum flagellatum TaxID=2895980 RepID=UPI0031451DD1